MPNREPALEKLPLKYRDRELVGLRQFTVLDGAAVATLGLERIRKVDYVRFETADERR